MSSRMAWAGLAVGLILIAGLAVSEAAMQPSTSERLAITAIFVSTAAVTVVAGVVVRRWQHRAGSVRTLVWVVSASSAAVAAVGVVLAAQTMFFSNHDRNLVLVSLGLGVGLGVVLAVWIAGSLTSDMAKIADAAAAVEGGNLSARSGVSRRDELGDTARAFDRMAARLEASEQERIMLLASIGHDLRTPLASLQAAIEALQDGLAPEPDAYLSAMAGEVDGLRRLVEDLFLMSRIDSGALEPRLEDADLGELVDEAVEAMAPLAGTRRIRLAADCPGPVPALLDPAAIGRILRNLLDNAIRHGPEGSEVWVRVEVDEGRATLSVVDEGDGFGPDLVDTALDRFVMGDPARSSGGAGLGLSIAQGLAELHGGRVTLLPGPGGQVTVELPVNRPMREPSELSR